MGRGRDRYYVNTTTGNLIIQSVDDTLDALGLDFAGLRTYNSQGLTDEDNGDQWRLGVHQRLSPVTGGAGVNTAGSQITKTFGDGADVVYAYNTTRSRYESGDGDGANDFLSWNGSVWTWTDGSTRATEEYASIAGTQRVRFARDPDGNTVTYNYQHATHANLLTSITMAGSTVQTVAFDYDPNRNLTAMRVVSFDDATGTVQQTQTLTRYRYDGLHRLRQVIVDLTPLDNTAPLPDANGDGLVDAAVANQTYITSYAYDGNSRRILSISQNDGSSVTFGYQNIDGDHRLTSVTDAQGRTTTFAYSEVMAAGGTPASASADTDGLSNQLTTNHPLDVNALSTPPGGGWGNAGALESEPAGSTASAAQVAFDGNGDGFAVWTVATASATQVRASRYMRASNSWASTPTTLLSAAAGTTVQASLAMDAAGNAVVAWLSGSTVNARRYIAGSWGAAAATPLSTVGTVRPSVAVNGSHAAVMWSEGAAGARSAHVSRWTGTSWTGKQNVETQTGAATDLHVAVDNLGNVITTWTQNLNGHSVPCVWTNEYRVASGGWHGPMGRDPLSPAALSSRIVVDGNGDAFLSFAQDGEAFLMRYSRTDDTWSEAQSMDGRSGLVDQTSMAIDAAGNAVLAWIQNDGSVNSVYARVYNASTRLWSNEALIDNLTTTPVVGTLKASIAGSYASAVWLQSDGTRDNAYAATFDGTAWAGATVLETSTQAPTVPSIAIDSLGNASAVWIQSNGTSPSVYFNRFTAGGGGPSYLIPAGATWQSVADALYHVNSAAAGSALQAALGNPALVAGGRLYNLPATLSVTSTVPWYYIVLGGDTWSGITQKVYDTSNANAVAALQAALGNPALGTGDRLTMPLTLSYATGGTGPAVYQRTVVTDPMNAGFDTIYHKDGQGRLVSLQSPSVNGARIETRYTYDPATGNVATITQDPTGLNRITTFTYDAATGLLLNTRDSLGNTVSRTYNASNQLETETSYLVRDPDGAGENPPLQPLTTRYVYDGEHHLRFVVSAEGGVTEHVYAGNGTRTTTYRYAANKYTGAYTESALDAWVTGPPSQRAAALERIDYVYDFRGNVSTISRWAATNASGGGTGPAWITRFVYDQRGQLKTSIESHGEASATSGDFVTQYTYDGLGRALKTTSWVGAGDTARELVSIEYQDSTRTTVKTFAGGRTQTEVFNASGERTSVALGPLATGSVRYTYDANGRERVVEDQTGIKTFCFYDNLGRKIGYVDGDGSVTEYIYNRAHQLIKTLRYGTRLSSATLAALGGTGWSTTAFAALRTEANPAQSPLRITRNVYDASGALVFTVDELGAITKNVYDGAGRLTDQIRRFTTQSIGAAVDEVLPSAIADTPHAEDRRTRFFYNADGQLTGTLDGAGYLEENRYDAAGRLVTTIGYYNASDAGRWLTGTLDTLRPGSAGSVAQLDAERDIYTRFFYDAQGRKIGELDGQKYLTEFTYDLAPDAQQRTVRTTLRYDRRLTDTNNATSFADLRAAAIAPPAVAVHATRYTYDGLGQLITEVDFDNTETLYSYDVAGNLIATTRANGSAEARTARARYDALGRLERELTAEGSVALAALPANATQLQIDDVWSKFGVTYGYDHAGRRISATVRPNDAQTNTTYYYYDDDGRVRFELDARGRVSENRYDAFGQRTDRLEYWRTISLPSQLGGLLNPTLANALKATETADVHEKTTYGYSLRGEETSTTTVAGATASMTYNVFGELETSNAGIGFTPHTYLYDKRGMLQHKQRGSAVYETRVYDAFGRLSSVTDARGNTSTSTYDRLGREVTTQQSGDSNASLVTYDAFSRKLRVRDKLLNETIYQYDDATRTVIVTTPEGIAVATVHGRHGDTVSVTANGNTTTYSYDRNGRLTGASDNLGTLEGRAYDRAGRQIEARDARGTVTTLAYDAANRLMTRTVDSAAGGLALVTSYAYDPLSRVMEVTEPGNRVTRTEYDRDGRVAAVVVDPGGNPSRTEYQYDEANNTELVIEGVGSTAGTPVRRTLYVYDALGRRTDEYVDPASLGDANSLDLRTQYRYDGNGNVTRKIDALGNSTWFVYDAQNRVVQTIDSLGGVTQLAYDSEDRVTVTRRFFNTVALPAGDVPVLQSVSTTVNDRVTRTVYDRDGRERYTLQTLSATGSPGNVTEQAVVTERTFDAAGNVTRTRIYRNVVTVPGTLTTSTLATALTSAQNDLAILHAEDRVEWTAYDVRGRVVFAVDGSGAVAKSQYDASGNVTGVIAYAERVALSNLMTAASLTTWSEGASIAGNAANRVTRSWYDTLDRLRFTRDAEGYLVETRHLDATRQTQSIVYAGIPTIAAGATLSQVAAAAAAAPNQALNQSTTQTLDAAGRVVQVTDAEGRSEYFGYDALGNKIRYVNKKGANANDTAFMWTYEYDANGRLTYERSPAVDFTTVTESVPGGGALTATNTNARLVTRFDYDALGNLRFRREAHGTTQERVTEYRYDALGRQTRTVFPAVGVYNPSGDSQLGNGAAVTRSEDVNVPLYTEVAYDALGNAFRNRDLAGNYSFKAYDALGRVTHEVDALGYVTSYGYDTFGNQTGITRHSAAVTSAIPTGGSSLFSADVTSRLQSSASLDRTIVTVYDRLDRVAQVIQPSVSNFVANAGSSGGTTFTAAATTISEYNAFGMLVRSRELLTNAPSYSDTYFYYDRLGQKTAEVDPLGHLTVYEYDETGDLKRRMEYARPRTGTLDTSTYGTAVTTTRSNAMNHAAGYDRETTFTYDRLNRRKTETRVGIEHSTLGAAGTAVSSDFADQVTTYDYDFLGNQTRVTQSVAGSSLVTHTWYDVLGRVIAVAEPARDPGNGGTLIPYVRMARDAFGNLVQQTVYGGGAVSIPASGLPTAAAAPAASPNRISTFLLDSRDHMIRTTDPLGFNRFASYNARGEVAKEWQVVVNPGDPATSADDRSETLVTLYHYDALGRQTSVKEPQRHDGASTISVTRVSQYNSFGEITSKGVVGAQGASGQQEYFDYDRAGRVWRTNSGDGVNKIYLYNLAGQVTAELRSQTEDLGSGAFTSAQDVVNNVPAAKLMRTETRHDARGLVVEQRLPTFSVDNGIEQVASDVRLSTVAGVAYVNWSGATDPNVAMRFEYRALGSTGGYSTLGVETLPEARLGANVFALYNQSYEYRISYCRNSEVTAYAESSGTFRVARGITTTLSIAQNAPDPASEVSALAVSQSNGIIGWAAPADTSVVAKLRYKVAGTPPMAWQPELTATRSGGNFQVDARTALADAGNYDYEIEYTRNSTVIARHAGQLFSAGSTAQRNVRVDTSTENPLAPYSQPIPVPNVNGRLLTWPGPGDASITPTFEYKLTSASSYTSSLAIDRSTSTWSVNTNAVANNGYHYRIQYKIGNRVVAEQIGTFNIAANGSITITTAGVTRDAAPPATELVSNISGTGNVLGAGSSGVVTQTGSQGYDHRYPTTVYRWNGSNSVSLSWASVGSQAVRVVLDYSSVAYQSSPSVAQSVAQNFASGGSGVTFTWGATSSVWYTGSELMSVPGGVRADASIRVRVYAQDGSGAYAVLLRDSATANATPASLTWSAPADAALTPTFNYYNGSSWVTRATTRSGNTVRVDLSDLAQGNYYYELRYTKPGAVSTASGTFQIAGATANKLTQGNSTQDPLWLNPTASGSRVNWSLQPPAGTTVRFNWYNGSAWVERAHDTDGTNYSVDMSGMAAGSYAYDIYYVRSGESYAYARVTGTLTVGVTTQTVQGALTVGTPTTNVVTPTARITPVGIAGDTLSWTQAKSNAADTVRVLYTFNGTTHTAAVAGSGPSYSASFTQLPSGTTAVAWSIEYLSAGETDPYAKASGQTTFTLYYSQSASVTSVSPQQGVTGYDHRYPTTVYQWSGSNSVNLNWASVGSQPVRVVFDYHTLGYASSASVAASVTQDFASGNTGVTMGWGSSNTRWYDWQEFAPIKGGIDATRPMGVKVYGRDAGGNYTILLRDSTVVLPPPQLTINSQAPVYPSGVQQISAPVDLGNGALGWTTPPAAGAAVVFKYNGTEVGTTSYGSGRQVNLSGLADGTYTYEITYTNGTPGVQNPYARATGSFTIARAPGPAGQLDFALNAALATDPLVNGADPLDTVVAIDQMNVPTDPAGGYLLQETTGTPSIPATYRIEWRPLVGKYTRGGTFLPHYSVSQGRYLFWSDPPTVLADADKVFEWRAAGSTGAWTAKTIEKIFDGQGNRFLGVNVGTMVSGSFEYRIRYVRAGETNAFAVRTGLMTNPAAAGSVVVDTTANGIRNRTDLTPRTQQSYDRWGNVISITDAHGAVTDLRYDQLGQLLEKKLPAVEIVAVSAATGAIGTPLNERPTHRNYYDLLGRLIATRDANGYLSTARLNDAGQTLRATNADATYESYVYDAFGNRTLQIDERNFRTRYTFNAMNLLEKIEQEAVLDALAGNATAAIISQSYLYDQAGRRIVDTDGKGMSTRYWYDLLGNVVKRLSASNAVTAYEYDLLGNKTQETDAIGGVKNWTYDYFGRLVTHVELGTFTYTPQVATHTWSTTYTSGYVHTYAYDFAGLNLSHTSTGGIDIRMSYDAAGHLVKVLENSVAATGSGLASVRRETRYAYDALGRHSREQSVVDGIEYQDSRIGYDAAGRMKSVWDIGACVTFSYDANGNRTRIQSESSSVNNAQTGEMHLSNAYDRWWNYLSNGWFTNGKTLDQGSTDLWYRYDVMNRLVLSRGWNVNGVVVADSSEAVNVPHRSIELGYDATGNRSYHKQWGWAAKYTVSGGTYSMVDGFSVEESKFDGLGRLIESKKDGMLVGSYVYDKTSRQTYAQTSQISGNFFGTSRTHSVYGNDGRLLSQRNEGNTNTSPNEFREQSVMTFGESQLVLTWNGDTPRSYWTNGYDAAGVLRAYEVAVRKPNGDPKHTSSYKLSYRAGEGYQEVLNEHTAIGELAPLPANTQKRYDINGNLISVQGTNSAHLNRYFAYDGNGQMLVQVRAQSDGTLPANAFANAVKAGSFDQWARYFHANGASVGNMGALASFFNGQPSQSWFFDVDDGTVREASVSAPPQIVASSGDTLRRIALRIYGDANLWYVLADENGITNPDEVLTEGMTIRIPNQVVSLQNRADVFKPLDAGKVIGDTSPVLDYPSPPPPKKGCGIVAMFLMVVIAVVVTVFTAGVATGLLSGAMGSSFGAIMAAGAAGMTSLGVVAGAAVGAVSSIVSQGIGMALGLQEDFDWKAVAVGAIGGAVSGGLGKAADAAQLASTAAAGAKVSALAKVGQFLDKIGTVGKAIVGNVLNQGLGIAAGLQKKFDWRSLAQAAASAPLAEMASDYVAGKMGGEAALNADRYNLTKFAASAAATVTTAAVRSAMGGRFGVAQVAADVFGNAVGNSIVDTFVSRENAWARYRETDEFAWGTREEQIQFLVGKGAPEQVAAQWVDSDEGRESIALMQADTLYDEPSEFLSDEERLVRFSEFRFSAKHGVQRPQREPTELELVVSADRPFDKERSTMDTVAGVIDTGSRGIKKFVDIMGGPENASAAMTAMSFIAAGPVRAVSGLVFDKVTSRPAQAVTEWLDEKLYTHVFRRPEMEVDASARTLSGASSGTAVEGMVGMLGGRFDGFIHNATGYVKKADAFIGAERDAAARLDRTPGAANAGGARAARAAAARTGPTVDIRKFEPDLTGKTEAQKRAFLKEYNKQLLRQEKALNSMTVDQFLDARAKFKDKGRDNSQGKLGRQFEKEVATSIEKRLLKSNPNLSRADARKMAQAQAKDLRSGLAALHEPDSVIGGTKATRMGSKEVNSSIGASWGKADNPNSRLAQLERYALDVKNSASGGGVMMNIRFGITTGAQ